jgi:hypothetical protein
VLVAATASPGFAKAITVKDPASAMRTLYAGLEEDNFDIELPLSQRLKGLIALDRKETGRDEVGRIDFDYFINGQDSKITDVQVAERDVHNSSVRRIIVVRFKNFDEKMENHFFWEKATGGWVLDDVRYLDGKEGYTLSLVLKYGWDGPED